MKIALRIAAALGAALVALTVVLAATSFRGAATGLFEPRPTPPVRTHRVVRPAGPAGNGVSAGAILDTRAGRRDDSDAFLVEGPLPIQIDAASGDAAVGTPVRVVAVAKVYPVEHFPCAGCGGGSQGRPLAPGQKPLAVGYSPVFELGRGQSMRVPTYIPLPELPPGEYMLSLEARLHQVDDLSAPEIPLDRSAPGGVEGPAHLTFEPARYSTYMVSNTKIRVPARPAGRSIFGL